MIDTLQDLLDCLSTIKDPASVPLRILPHPHTAQQPLLRAEVRDGVALLVLSEDPHESLHCH